MKLYKIISVQKKSINGGKWTWTPGEWTPFRTPNICCAGWHLLESAGVVNWWFPGTMLWEAEGKDGEQHSYYKHCFGRAKITRCLGRMTTRRRKSYTVLVRKMNRDINGQIRGRADKLRVESDKIIERVFNGPAYYKK